VLGFVWIDEGAGELARIEGEVTEDISVGVFFGKIYKGSHFMQERYEFLLGLWLASFSQYDLAGRKLFSGFSVHEHTFYSNYRYIGPPKDALATIRQTLGYVELDKPRPEFGRLLTIVEKLLHGNFQSPCHFLCVSIAGTILPSSTREI